MLRNTRFCNEKCSKKKRFCFEKSSFRIRTWSFFIYDRQLRISCNSLFNDDRLIFHPYCKLFEQEFEQRKKESILNTTFIFVIFTRVSTITRACLLGRNEELFELYPHRGSSNSIDNWPRSKTFLLKLRREKQINPFQRFVKRQESTTIGMGSNRRQYRTRIYEAWILQLVRCNVIIRIRSPATDPMDMHPVSKIVSYGNRSARSISRHA